MPGLRDTVVNGAVWATLQTLVAQGVGFVVSMVLARLLSPSDYGTVAMLSVFFAVAMSLSSCGFGNALVQKKEVGDLEFNSVFYVSLAISVVVYALFYFAAPYIAEFYHAPVLCPVTRVSALSFVFNAINGVQIAELNRKMRFDLRFRINLITSVVSAACGITLAYMGYGVWAIVTASLASSIASVFAYWTIIAWRPKPMFSFAALRPLFSYGWKLSLSGLVHTVYSNLYGFIIGRCYTPADLAFVNKGNSMPNLLMTSIDGTINSVSFPALAQIQDDKGKLRDGMRRMIQCSTYLVFPLMAGLALCARLLLLVLYGGQWEPATPYVQIACLSFALLPFNTINTNAISAMGRSDVFLALDCVKKAIGITLTIVSLRHGVVAFMLTMALVQSPVAILINTFANGRLLGYDFVMQVKDVASSALLTAAMSVVVYGFRILVTPLADSVQMRTAAMIVELMFLSLIGALVYFGLSAWLKPRPFREFAGAVRPLLNRKLPWTARFMERMAG